MRGGRETRAQGHAECEGLVVSVQPDFKPLEGTKRSALLTTVPQDLCTFQNPVNSNDSTLSKRSLGVPEEKNMGESISHLCQ